MFIYYVYMHVFLLFSTISLQSVARTTESATKSKKLFSSTHRNLSENTIIMWTLQAGNTNSQQLESDIPPCPKVEEIIFCNIIYLYQHTYKSNMFLDETQNPNIYIVVPPYPKGVHFKTPSRCPKPPIVQTL